MPPKEEKKPTDGKMAKNNTKVRQVPNFTKLHGTWASKLETGKACAKKPSTVAHEFNLSNKSCKVRKTPAVCLNDGSAGGTSRSIPRLKTVGPVQNVQKSKSHIAKPNEKAKEARKNSLAKLNVEDFKVDDAALKSILDHIGVSNGKTASPEVADFVTPMKLPLRHHAQTDIRSSIYYTGKKKSNPVTNIGLGSTQKVKSFRASSAKKAQLQPDKDEYDLALSGSSPLLRGPRVTAMRQSIYKRYDYSKRPTQFGNLEPKDNNANQTVVSRAPTMSARRVPRPCITGTSPAARTPRVEGRFVTWKDTTGKSPKALETSTNDKLATTLTFNEGDDDTEEVVSKSPHVSKMDVHVNEMNAPPTDLDNTQTIREIEALLEADLAADNLENMPPPHCPVPFWHPSMANFQKGIESIYDLKEDVPINAFPVSSKTIDRIPFGVLSTCEVKKRSISPSDDFVGPSPPAADSSEDTGKSRSPDKSLSPVPCTVADGKKNNVASQDVDLKCHTPPASTSIYHDPKPSTPRLSSFSRLSLCEQRSPVSSPLRVLSPNVKLEYQRSPNCAIKTESSESKVLNFTTMSVREIEMFGQENISWASPKRRGAPEVSYLSPKVARLSGMDGESPTSRLSAKFKRRNTSPKKAKGMTAMGKFKLNSLSNDQLNESLSDSIFQLDELQTKADLLISQQENEDPKMLLHQLALIEREENQLKYLKENLRRQLSISEKKNPAGSISSDEQKTLGANESSPVTTQAISNIDSSSTITPHENGSYNDASSVTFSTSCSDAQHIAHCESDKPTFMKRCGDKLEYSLPFSPKPKMAGSVQIVDSPFSRETKCFPVPIRTPLALRNEADLVSQTSSQSRYSGSSRLYSPELSIDGVNSSLELSSTNVSGTESTEQSKLDTGTSSRERCAQTFVGQRLCNIALGKDKYSSPSTLNTNVTSTYRRPVTVATHDSLNLSDNLKITSWPSPDVEKPLSQIIVTANAFQAYEEAMLNDEVSLYACRLGDPGYSSHVGSCRPHDPVAKILNCGDDTHIVPIGLTEIS